MSAPKPTISIRKATLEDVPALYKVVNEAYRAAGGWTGEQHLVAGERITQEGLTEQLTGKDKKRVVVLVGEDEAQEIIGCVAIKPWEEDEKEAEVGMLSVSIKAQSGGIGTQLIRSAFDACRSEFHATTAVVQVLSVREDITAWYKRLGFLPVGEPKPTYGWINLLVKECNFVVLKKELSKN